MKWIKVNEKEELHNDDYVAVIERRGGRYWASCYRIERNGIRVRKFTFPPSKSLAKLKKIVLDNSVFYRRTK